jgi:hypothetical protein
MIRTRPLLRVGLVRCGATFVCLVVALKCSRPRLKCDGARAKTRFRLLAKRTSPFKLAGASVWSATGSQGVRISGSNAGYTMFRGSVKSTGCPLHSPVSPSLPLPCVSVCHHILTGLYLHLPASRGPWSQIHLCWTCLPRVGCFKYVPHTYTHMLHTVPLC